MVTYWRTVDDPPGSRTDPATRERFRSATAPRIERRAEGDGAEIVVGHFAVFDEWTWIGGRSYGFRERVRPGAFKNAIAERQDIRALFNHDPNYIFGRWPDPGTLRISEDSRGGRFEADMPESQLLKDILVSPIRRGEITGSSFSFAVRPGGALWRIIEGPDGDETWERDILDVDLFDVGPVTFPAYSSTDAGLAARSLAAWEAEKSRREIGRARESRIRSLRMRGRTINEMR
jgi:HK97 family phage prohead protease